MNTPVIDHYIVPNYELYRHYNLSILLLKQQKSVFYIGASEQQKSTLLKLVAKQVIGNHNLALQVLPNSCFLNQRFLINTLKKEIAHKTVFLIDDYHLMDRNFNFKLVEVLSLIHKNQYSCFTTDSQSLTKLMQPFQLVASSRSIPIGKKLHFTSQIDIDTNS